MSADADRRLERHARRHHGVFDLDAAERAGVPRSTVYARAVAGEYVEDRPRIFRFAVVPHTREAVVEAAVRSIGGDVVAARWTALWLHGLVRWRDDRPVEVLDRNRCPKGEQVADIRVHRTSYWLPHHVTDIRGTRVTTAERSICDVAGEAAFGTLRRIVTDAARRGFSTPESLLATVAELGRFRGKRQLVQIARELSPAVPATRNEFEAAFLRITTDAGIPPSAMNHAVVDGFGRRRELDAVYLERRQPVELDSREFHALATDVNDDVERENALVLAGWKRPLRFTWWQVTGQPAVVIATLRRALDIG